MPFDSRHPVEHQLGNYYSSTNIDFEALLGELELLRSELKSANEEEVSKKIRLLKGKIDLKEIYKKIISRAVNETDYFDEWAESGLDPSEVYENKEISFGKIKIITEDMPDTMGYFDPLSQKIVLPKKDFEPIDQALIRLSTEGLSVLLEKVIHEVVHSHQHSKSKLKNLAMAIWSYLGSPSLDTELSESHAYRSGGIIKRKLTHMSKDGSYSIENSNIPTSQASLMELLNHLKLKPYEGDIDKLIFTIKAIDQLKALGFGVKEIGKIVESPGSWDAVSGSYEQVERTLDLKMGEKGLDEYDIDNLIQANKIKRDIERLKVRKIANIELDLALQQSK